MKLTWNQILSCFETACINQSWIGSQHPDDHDEILADYKGWYAIMRKLFPPKAIFDLKEFLNVEKAKTRSVRSGSGKRR